MSPWAMFWVLSKTTRLPDVILGKMNPLLLPAPGEMCIIADGCGEVVPTPICEKAMIGHARMSMNRSRGAKLKDVNIVFIHTIDYSASTVNVTGADLA